MELLYKENIESQQAKLGLVEKEIAKRTGQYVNPTANCAIKTNNLGKMCDSMGVYSCDTYVKASGCAKMCCEMGTSTGVYSDV